jgi:HSP20 family protein
MFYPFLVRSFYPTRIGAHRGQIKVLKFAPACLFWWQKAALGAGRAAGNPGSGRYSVFEACSTTTEDNMMFRTMFPGDLFAELDRLQRDVQQAFEGPSIRGLGRGGYPALNVGNAPQSIELYAFAPGLDPQSIEVNLERGVLTIAGERVGDTPQDEKTTAHINERFAGRFRRVISLPDDDINPSGVSAQYRDGVLHVSVKRRESAKPRRIAIQ